MRHTIQVLATWDPEAKVYFAESEDVPGLATEAESLDVLIVKLREMIPELLELNDDGDLPSQVPFELMTRSSAPFAKRC